MDLFDLFGFLKKKEPSSGTVAKDRLKLVLVHDRVNCSSQVLEMLKGDIKERFEAYKAAIESNVMQIDEARFMEDLPALGLTWIKIGLKDVLYDIKTGKIYTPNTGNLSDLKGGEKIED